jgi:hypothetical protein
MKLWKGFALSDVAVALLTIAFACACAAFVWQPTLASFADDSVSYLVMAQVFSPWQAASPAVTASFAREAFYPPLFPLLLALAGAAHHTAWAHALMALLLAGAIPLVYALGVRWLEDRRAAAAAALCVALLPSLWVNAKGILSEPLFCLLLLATFCVLDTGEGRGGRPWAAALLMTAMALTRTAALPMIAAYALWALARRHESRAKRMRNLVPAFVAVAAYGMWVLLRPSLTEDGYARIILERGRDLLDAPGGVWSSIVASLLRQANALAEAWVSAPMLFWVEGKPLRPALAGVVGALALSGMAIRIFRGHADGWMTAAYLTTLLAWPYYDQMGRFLFPVLPVLVLYAFVASAAILHRVGRPQGVGIGVTALLLLSLTLPAMAFIHQRAQAPGRQPEIVDWYRTPGLTEARARAQVHLDLFADMGEIRQRTGIDDHVMWVTPSYIALLADRRGIAAPTGDLAPAAYRLAVRESGADYVFLSRYHPRDTIRTGAWQAGTGALAGTAKVVHLRTQGAGGLVTSMLLKADK